MKSPSKKLPSTKSPSMSLPSTKSPSISVPSRKRPEQSAYTLARAVFTSFFLHSAVVAAVLLLQFLMIPKYVLPPAYQVKLVGQPKESAGTPAAAPVPPKKEAAPEPKKPLPKQKQAAAPVKKVAPNKSALPDLVQQKPKKAAPEPPPSEPARASEPTKTESKAEGVAVGTSSQDFKFPPYLAIIRERIEQNWNPPPVSGKVKVKVIFTVLRAGRLGETKLAESSGNDYFDIAAKRAILMASPFPPLPEGFYKEFEVFSVDFVGKD